MNNGMRFLGMGRTKLNHGWMKKTGIGPEPKLLPSDLETTAEACIYADDNSAGETGTTKEELKEKTENMLHKIFEHMRSSRLLINSDKTKVMMFATTQKRSKNDLNFHVDIEGVKIKEIEHATLLGVTLSNTFSWNKHIDEVLDKFSKRLNGC